MKMVVEIWDFVGKYWEVGGGGIMWDVMVFDLEFNLMYVGVGNGFFWNCCLRSLGGGDNLFFFFIVVLNLDNGEYVWYY